jgi:hypothetical protein
MTENQNYENPLSELISDEIYQLLSSRNLLNEKTLRDYQIKKKFKRLRMQRISANEAIEKIREEYPYLQFDSIRKIIYVGNKNLDL